MLVHPRSGRPLYAGVLLVALILGLNLGVHPVAQAQTAPSPQPGLGIGPSRLEIVASDGFLSEVVTIRNEGNVPMSVTVEARTLGHDILGGLVFPEAVSDPRLDVRTGTVELAPGAEVRYPISAQVPEGEAATYVAVVATGRGPDLGQLVDSTIRVATVILLQRDGAWEQALEVEGVELSPAVDERGGQLLAIVRNTGEVHVKPTGRATLLHDGVVIGEVDLESETVIPGYARALRGFWSPPAGIEGPVEVKIDLDEPSARGGGTVDVRDPLSLQPIINGEVQPPAVVSAERPGDAGRVFAISIAALLLLVTIALLLVAWRSRRRKHDDTILGPSSVLDDERVDSTV